MKLMQKATGKEIKEGDKISATLSCDSKPRNLTIHKIWEPNTHPSSLETRQTYGLIEVNASKKGDINSWQQYYPHVLGLKFVKEGEEV